MRLIELAERCGARIIVNNDRADAEVANVHAGDNVSDLLAESTAATLLVTNLRNPLLLRVAELMDAPGICLVDGHVPAPELTAAAQRQGTVIMVSPWSLFETCGRMYGGRGPSEE